MSKGLRVTFRLGLIMTAIAALVAVLWLSSSPPSQSTSDSTPTAVTNRQTLPVEVLDSQPHDPAAYTQGLLWYEGHLYESTGQYGESSVRRVDPESGEVLSSRSLSADLFGEGLARVEDRLIQLTWNEGTALVWDRETLREVNRLSYEGPGWGLCYNGQHLVMSNGTSLLTFRDPETFAIERQVEVVLRDGAVGRLNELECVEDWVYANVYTTDWIVKIEPLSGRVASLIDASGLLSPEERVGTDVLNGIAYDPEEQVFYLTGKLWPRLFIVRFHGDGAP